MIKFLDFERLSLSAVILEERTMFTDDKMKELKTCLAQKLDEPVNDKLVKLVADVWKAGFDHAQSSAAATANGSDGLASLLSALKAFKK